MNGSTAFTVRSEIAGADRVVVELEGELDGASADALVTESATWPAGAHVTLDVARVRFVDSAGLRALVRAHAHAERRGGSLRVHAPGPRLVRLLQLTDLIETLGIDTGPDGR